MVLIELAAKLLDFLGWRTVGGWGRHFHFDQAGAWLRTPFTETDR
jgi:hypothetical protein